MCGIFPFAVSWQCEQKAWPLWQPWSTRCRCRRKTAKRPAPRPPSSSTSTARTATRDVGDSSGPPPTHLPSRRDRCVLITSLTVVGGRNGVFVRSHHKSDRCWWKEQSVCVSMCVSGLFVAWETLGKLVTLSAPSPWIGFCFPALICWSCVIVGYCISCLSVA